MSDHDQKDLEPPVKASAIEHQEIEWMIDGFLPFGMISLVAGRPGEGKSTLECWLAAHVSKTLRRNVILANFEDSPSHVIRPRLEAAGAALDRVHVTTRLRLPDHVDALRRKVEQTKARLVIIDPVAACLKVSIYNDQDVRTALTPLTELAADTGCAIVLISHVTKNVSANAHPLMAIGGSGGGLAGAARAAFFLGTNPEDEDERILACVKMNVAAFPQTGIVFEMDSVAVGEREVETGRLVKVADDWRGDPVSLLGVKKSDQASKGKEKEEAAGGWLTQYLSHGPRPVKQLEEDARLTGFSWATIRRASVTIGVVKGRVGGGSGSFSTWRLPDGHPDLVDEQAPAPAAATSDDDVVSIDDDELDAWRADQ